MTKYVIAVKFSGRMNGEFFERVDEKGRWYTTEDVNEALTFDDWNKACDAYRQLDDKAFKMGIYLLILKV